MYNIHSTAENICASHLRRHTVIRDRDRLLQQLRQLHTAIQRTVVAFTE